MPPRSWILPLVLVTATRCGDDGGTAAATTGDETAQADETTAATPTDPGTADTSTGAPPTAGDPTTGDPTTGGGVPCDTLADCPPEPCRQAVACNAAQCVYEATPDGTPLPDQSPGDCAEEVCDGDGGTRLTAADDPPDDGVLCTLDVCDGMTPQHLPGMAPCYGGDPGTAGVGLCAAGVQACDDRGVPTGPCVGEVLPADEDCDLDLADEDCDGAVNESGLACACEPGAAQPCYTGAPGTAGTGACLAGQQVCAASGLEFESCADEVVPTDEDCDPGELDEDCDGEVNESGPTCACGDGFLSNDEQCDDGNTVDDPACSATCTAPEQVQQFVSGAFHVCAILTGGKVKCWGWGGGGHGNDLILGDGPGEMGDALPYTDLGDGVAALQLAAGEFHTCAIVTGGLVKCWGQNTYGRLGLGDSEHRGDDPEEMGDYLPYVSLGAGKVAVQIAAGYYHTCARFTDGTVKCWGLNFSGSLGTEDSDHRGDDPGDMGDNLLPIKLGTGRTALAVDTGYQHTCAVLDDHSIKCWGYNYLGRLGLEDQLEHGNLPNSMGDNLKTVRLGVGKLANSVSAGLFHTCAVLEGGLVKCWGAANDGALGLEDSENHGSQPNSMGDVLPVVKLGQGQTAIDVRAGFLRTCALLSGGGVKCWGRSHLGFSGTFIGDSPGEMGDDLPLIDLGDGQTAAAIDVGIGPDVGLGGNHTCARLAAGGLKCWGENDGGVLGQGDTLDRGASPADMGDNLSPIDL